MDEVAAEAKRAFAALQSLDPHLMQRRELRASGVAEHRIEALYGRTWAALVPAIIEHLRVAKDEELLLEGSITPTQTDDLWNIVPEKIHRASDDDDDADFDALDALDLENALGDYIVKRIMGADEDTKAEGLKIGPSTITSGIWAANWFMMNRAALTPKRRALADKLMVAIARTIAL